MTCCGEVHKEFDKYANKDVQVGDLAKGLNIQGKVAWYIHQGPYAGTKRWQDFWEKFGKMNLKMRGPPGEIYICNPGCHEKDQQREMLTLMFCPVES